MPCPMDTMAAHPKYQCGTATIHAKRGRATKADGGSIKVSDEDMAALNIHRDPFHGEWNYTLKPQHGAVVL